MLGAFLATCLFAVSAVAANRSVRQLGSLRANVLRLLVALFCLGLWAHLFGQGLSGEALPWFILSGIVGFGFGDIGVFMALPLLGSRLTVLMTQTLAAPIAGATEFVWLGTILSLAQVFFGTLILVGVAVALGGKIPGTPSKKTIVLGIGFGLLAAIGQGVGAVISRHAYEVAALAGENIDGATAAYQRVMGGLIVAVAFFLWKRPALPKQAIPPQPASRKNNKALWVIIGFVLLNAFSGPILGVSAFQWALENNPSAVVLPIVALTPIVILPLAWIMEGDRPTRRGIVGALVAVVGAIGLSLS